MAKEKEHLSASRQGGWGIYEAAPTVISSMQAQSREIAAREGTAQPVEEMSSPSEAQRAERNQRSILSRIFHRTA